MMYGPIPSAGRLWAQIRCCPKKWLGSAKCIRLPRLLTERNKAFLKSASEACLYVVSPYCPSFNPCFPNRKDSSKTRNLILSLSRSFFLLFMFSFFFFLSLFLCENIGISFFLLSLFTSLCPSLSFLSSTPGLCLPSLASCLLCQRLNLCLILSTSLILTELMKKLQNDVYPFHTSNPHVQDNRTHASTQQVGGLLMKAPTFVLGFFTGPGVGFSASSNRPGYPASNGSNHSNHTDSSDPGAVLDPGHAILRCRPILLPSGARACAQGSVHNTFAEASLPSQYHTSRQAEAATPERRNLTRLMLQSLDAETCVQRTDSSSIQHHKHQVLLRHTCQDMGQQHSRHEELGDIHQKNGLVCVVRTVSLDHVTMFTP